MKKIILMMLVFVSVSINAQKDVTKFLGIPVDGSKTEMKKKLIEKGFTYNALRDNFEGEFNGRNVNVYIVTNNNKVWRIVIHDANSCGESDIKIRFNRLCNQFARNKKYTAVNDSNYILPENEDIGYEMLVHKKRYEAAYYQDVEDSIAFNHIVQEALLQKYTQEQIDNPTDEQLKDILYTVMITSYDLRSKKSVWFMISEEKYGKYFISMFYDNEYNHSDGEDL